MRVIIGVDAARQALAAGESVVVVDGAAAVAGLLAEHDVDGRGRLAVLVGDPRDPDVLAAAEAMALELFPPAS
jgi:hypothetical protein